MVVCTTLSTAHRSPLRRSPPARVRLPIALALGLMLAPASAMQRAPAAAGPAIAGPAIAGAAVAGAAGAGAAVADDAVAGQVLVKARAGQVAALAARIDQLLPGSPARAAFAHLGSPVDRAGLSRILVVEVAPGTEDAAVAALAAEPAVEWAERNGRAGGITGQILPNDPSFAGQWALSQASDIDMDVPEAWFERGTTQAAPGLLVADVDTGYDTGVTSADWTGVIWSNPAETQNGVDDDGNGLVDDLHGWDFAYNDNVPDAVNPHGVETGGIIAARTNNGAQVAGIASGVTLLPLKTFDNGGFFPGSGPYAGYLSASTAIVYATDHGADLINNSWTNGTSPVQVINDAIQYAVDNGTRPIFSAGNSGGNQGWPAQNPLVIAVAAIDHFGIKSNWGFQSSTWGTWVDVCAAGTDVATTTTGGGVENFFAGTSASCPQVVGVAALVLSEDGDLTPSELRAVLMQGATSVDAMNPSWIGLLGAGHVNAYNSLALLAAWTDLGSALGGSFQPLFNAWGLAQPGARITLSLSHAAPAANCLLVAGFGLLGAPFKGGVLVPTTDIVVPGTTTPAGELALSPAMPPGLPSGTEIRLQFLVADAGAPVGVSLSNAMLMTVP